MFSAFVPTCFSRGFFLGFSGGLRASDAVTRVCVTVLLMFAVLVLYPVTLEAFTLPGSPLSLPGCKSGGVFTAYIIGCVRGALLEAVNRYLDAFDALLRPALILTITLAMIFFGIRLLLGESQLGPKASSFIIKIALVLFFTAGFGGLAPSIFSLIDGMSDIVSSGISSGVTGIALGACSKLVGTVTGGMQLWNRLDCLIGLVFGFGAVGGAGVSVLSLVGAALTSGTLAGTFMFAAFGAIFMLIGMVLRAVFVVIMAYVAVAFLIIISPIFIPLVLFNVTSRYFQAWLDQLISAMMQPVMMMGVLAFFLSVLEYVLVNPITFGLMGTMGLMDSFNSPELKDAIRMQKPLFETLSLPTDFRQFLDAGGGAKTGVSSVSSSVSPLATKSSTFNIFMPAIEFPPNQTVKMKFMAVGMGALMLVNYVMYKFVEFVPLITQQMVGGAASSAAFNLAEMKMPFENKVQQAGANAEERFKEGASGQDGTFIRGVLRTMTGNPRVLGPEE